MDEAGTLPTSFPPRRWSLGAESPISDPVVELPVSLRAPLKECTAGAADALPADYGDPDGLWVTVRRQNPFDVLLLDDRRETSAETLLVRFRVLWKFWTQKLTIARQGATRSAIRQKYGEDLDSYVDNLQWAYDQLSAVEGMSFWRKRLQEQRLQTLWSRVSEMVDTALADGLLDLTEVVYLMSRAEFAGYEREEFATALRDALYARRFEPEQPPVGETESSRLASVRWATAENWTRIREAARQTFSNQVERYYVRIRQTGLVIGPVAADEVHGLIRASRVTAPDEVCVVGAAVWQPIVQSRFGQLLQSHLASTYTCPRCGHALTATLSSTATAWVLIVIGIITTAFIIGIVFVVLGLVMLFPRNRSQRWRCLQCGFSRW